MEHIIEITQKNGRSVEIGPGKVIYNFRGERGYVGAFDRGMVNVIWLTPKGAIHKSHLHPSLPPWVRFLPEYIPNTVMMSIQDLIWLVENGKVFVPQLVAPMLVMN